MSEKQTIYSRKGRQSLGEINWPDVGDNRNLTVQITNDDVFTKVFELATEPQSFWQIQPTNMNQKPKELGVLIVNFRYIGNNPNTAKQDLPRIIQI